jgi:O-antigen ligase
MSGSLSPPAGSPGRSAASWRRDAGAGDAARVGGAAVADRRLQILAVVVLVLTLLYAIQGIPGLDTADPTQTDHVNPFNSWIWLGLLALSFPILKRRWREVGRLLLSSWPLLLLFGYFGLSMTWALDPSASSRRFLFTVVQLAVFAILLTGIRRAPVVHVVIAAVCAVSALTDLMVWVVAPGIAMAPDGFQGLSGQKNQAGLLMMYGYLAVVPCCFLVRRFVWRALLAAGAVLLTALLIATKSSTSESVVISATLLMPLVLLAARLERRLIMAIAAVVVLGVLTVVLGYLAWCGMTATDPMLPLRGVTFTDRTDIWSFVVDEIHKRPLLGAGYSSFWGINPAVQPSLKTDQWFGVYAIINEGHEGYLDLLATGGVVGLAGGLFVLFRSIWMAGRALNEARPPAQAWAEGRLAYPTAAFYLALLLGLIVHNFTESNLFSNNGLLAVAFLLTTLDLEKARLAAADAKAALPARHPPR